MGATAHTNTAAAGTPQPHTSDAMMIASASRSRPITPSPNDVRPPGISASPLNTISVPTGYSTW